MTTGNETENLIQANNKSGKLAPHQTPIKNPRKATLESERALFQRFTLLTEICLDLKNIIHQKRLLRKCPNFLPFFT